MEKEKAIRLLQVKEVFDTSTGTCNYYRHTGVAFGVYTDGMQRLAEVAGAYWLIDAIFSYCRKEHYQLWTLEVKDTKAVLTMREDSERPEIVRQEIEYTDFPEGTWYFNVGFSGEYYVLMLPRED